MSNQKLSKRKSEVLKFLPHGFFVRNEGCYLDQDYESYLRKSAQQVKSCFPKSQLAYLQQSHSNKVVLIDDINAIPNGNVEGDAMVTRLCFVAISVVTADCVPILFADSSQRLIGAAHAGWKGALSGIIENTVLKMRELGAKEIRAAIGPAIQQKSYEVGKEFYKAFSRISSYECDEYFISTGEKYLFNLPSYCRSIIESLGITLLEDLGIDTYCSSEFFSHRRFKKYGSYDASAIAKYGRQFSALCLYD